MVDEKWNPEAGLRAPPATVARSPRPRSSSRIERRRRSALRWRRLNQPESPSDWLIRSDAVLGSAVKVHSTFVPVPDALGCSSHRETVLMRLYFPIRPGATMRHGTST